ncbi:uncharacterized protein [Apostichopus japonicus]|uniref:uncharacterized protein n=1 Tax=Stichopus japonicus TaxID=307972 RepID=UPI003AB5C680
MSHLRSMLYCLFCVPLIFCDEQERAAEACNEVDETQPYPTFVCKVMPEDPVCLVCPVYQEVDVEWFTTETRIAYGNFYVGKYDDLNVNICHQTNASLRLKSCRDELKYFQCRQGKKTLGEFKFICKQEELLVIERDSETIKDDTLTFNEDIVIRLRCLAQQVLPPLTMEWFVDSKRVYTESFFQYFSEETNFSISLEIYTGTIITSITCVAYGNYIQNMSRSISVIEDTLHTTQTPEELQPRQLENTWVIAVVVFGLISSGLFVCVYITVRQFRLTRNRQGNINSSNQMNVLDKDFLDTEQSIKRKKILTAEGRKELPKIPVDEENSQNSLNSGGSEPNYYSTVDVISEKDPRMLNENDISIIMNIKIGKIYKRWMGSIYLANETNKCVVVTTLTETLFRKKEIHWEAYIRKCLELPASNHLAKIEAISIQSNKLFLISEHLVCESMHKVLSRDTKDEKDLYCCSSLTVPDVIKHISGILEGMDILNTFGFLHPGLTTKKVLLTKGGQVKLFDFCLARDAPRIAALKKEQVKSDSFLDFESIST